MEVSKRQKQVAGVILKELDDVFRRLNLYTINGGMVSISSVKVTPDLLEARIYLSFFKTNDDSESLKMITNREWEIKKELTARIKNQVRRIPVLQFYADDTLEHAFKMEDLFKQIEEERKKNQSGNASS